MADRQILASALVPKHLAAARSVSRHAAPYSST